MPISANWNPIRNPDVKSFGDQLAEARNTLANEEFQLHSNQHCYNWRHHQSDLEAIQRSQEYVNVMVKKIKILEHLCATYGSVAPEHVLRARLAERIKYRDEKKTRWDWLAAHGYAYGDQESLYWSYVRDCQAIEADLQHWAPK